MFRNIINEAFKGNFSWFILLVNIGQFIMNITAVIIAIIALKNNKK